MAYCGAPTSKGGYCRNHAGRCPHHGIRASASGLAQPSTSSASSFTHTRPSPSGPSQRVAPARSATSFAPGTPVAGSGPWLTVGGHAFAAALVFVVAAIVINAVRLDTAGALAVTLVWAVPPFLIASWYWALCGAWNSLKPRRCHNRRRGPFVRCQHHRGVTLYDFLGLFWFLAAVGTALLFALPAIRSSIQA